jgi:hypothetical protein
MHQAVPSLTPLRLIAGVVVFVLGVLGGVGGDVDFAALLNQRAPRRGHRD